MIDSNYRSHLEQERAEYDQRYAHADIHTLPDFKVDPREQFLWEHYVGSLSEKHVLEVGSGDGRMACWLASKGAIVTAVDISEVGILMTQKRALFLHLENLVSAYCLDACQLETVIPINSIDLALGFSVLHHLPASELGHSLRAVLKVGGRAVFFENSNANPIYRIARWIRNNETTCGAPLMAKDASALVNEIGTGELINPRFGFFGLTKKYIFQKSNLYSSMVEFMDDEIDKIPGTRRWSAHMWVVARK